MTSKAEIRLRTELATLLPVREREDRRKIRTHTRLYTVDILVEDLNLVIEYDGAFYHAQRTEQDAAKTSDLTEAGWRVVRVREDPLPLLTENDLAVPLHADAKQIMDLLLPHLQNRFGIDPPGTREYLDGDAAVASDRADDIIDAHHRQREGA